jgi:O-Antigen ligase
MTNDDKIEFGLMTGLAITMIAGGTSLPSHENFVFISVLNLAMLAAAAWHMRNKALSQLPSRGLMLLGCAVALMSLQLIPLPPQIWSNLAGRQGVSEIFAATPLAGSWLPLSLDPSATRANILSLLPGIAAFAAALAIPHKHHRNFATLIVVIAALNIVAGFLQQPRSPGFFTNQNFYAAYLYCTIGFVFYLSRCFKKQSQWATSISVVAALLFVTAIGATGSRLSLCLAAVLVAACFLATLDLEKFKSAFFITFAFLACGVVMVGGAGLARMDELHSALDFRSILFSTSFEAAAAFFPVGSGFGSFVPVYQLFETPQSVQPYFINHAHNDWLELAIEGGLPVIIICLAFTWWFAGAAIATWTQTGHSMISKFASLTVAALLLHSVFDYPLRTASIMSVFGLCCGLLMTPQHKATTVKNSSRFESALP